MHYDVSYFKRYRKALGARIKLERQQLCLSLEECAARSGLSLLVIYDYERGKRNPSLEALLRLATALNVPLGRLCC